MEKKYKKVSKYFKNKRVLITGTTGFKGSWLSLWMQHMGASVLGISNGMISKPSNFNILNLKKKIKYKKIDIRNYNSLKKQINLFKPDFIFHLAAEAIVKRSYNNPKYTWETNTIGTLNLLDILKEYKRKVIAVIITSDKVYKNLEVKRGYKETDILGSFDPYSASKASADLATQSYIESFLKKKSNIKIAIARAGNVIGGGDWAYGRLIPDCVRSWSKNKKVIIRNPNSTRPWQHVFDVLKGYIYLAINLKKDIANGEIFNFGPKIDKNSEVKHIVRKIQSNWSNAKYSVKKENNFFESKLLKLNSSKSKKILNWECTFNIDKTILFTINWYRTFYNKSENIFKFSLKQISDYKKLSKIE